MAVLRPQRGRGDTLIASSSDPGRLGRSAYHFIHPIMVAGIIVVAAADYLVLITPDAVGVGSTSWLILGGAGLYIAGLLAFKLNVWGRLSWQRAAALAALALLGLVAPHVTALRPASPPLRPIAADTDTMPS